MLKIYYFQMQMFNFQTPISIVIISVFSTKLLKLFSFIIFFINSQIETS